MFEDPDLDHIPLFFCLFVSIVLYCKLADIGLSST